jgi:hypothetical protein
VEAVIADASLALLFLGDIHNMWTIVGCCTSLILMLFLVFFFCSFFVGILNEI